MVTLRRGGQFAVIDDTTAQTEIPADKARKALRVLVAAGLEMEPDGGPGMALELARMMGVTQ